MTTRIETFVNLENQQVHAVFVDVQTGDGRTIGWHYGTFATLREAEMRLADAKAGRCDGWEEPE